MGDFDGYPPDDYSGYMFPSIQRAPQQQYDHSQSYLQQAYQEAPHQRPSPDIVDMAMLQSNWSNLQNVAINPAPSFAVDVPDFATTLPYLSPANLHSAQPHHMQGQVGMAGADFHSFNPTVSPINMQQHPQVNPIKPLHRAPALRHVSPMLAQNAIPRNGANVTGATPQLQRNTFSQNPNAFVQNATVPQQASPRTLPGSFQAMMKVLSSLPAEKRRQWFMKLSPKQQEHLKSMRNALLQKQAQPIRPPNAVQQGQHSQQRQGAFTTRQLEQYGIYASHSPATKLQHQSELTSPHGTAVQTAQSPGLAHMMAVPREISFQGVEAFEKSLPNASPAQPFARQPVPTPHWSNSLQPAQNAAAIPDISAVGKEKMGAAVQAQARPQSGSMREDMLPPPLSDLAAYTNPSPNISYTNSVANDSTICPPTSQDGYSATFAPTNGFANTPQPSANSFPVIDNTTSAFNNTAIHFSNPYDISGASVQTNGIAETPQPFAHSHPPGNRAFEESTPYEEVSQLANVNVYVPAGPLADRHGEEQPNNIVNPVVTSEANTHLVSTPTINQVAKSQIAPPANPTSQKAQGTQKPAPKQASKENGTAKRNTTKTTAAKKSNPYLNAQAYKPKPQSSEHVLIMKRMHEVISNLDQGRPSPFNTALWMDSAEWDRPGYVTKHRFVKDRLMDGTVKVYKEEYLGLGEPKSSLGQVVCWEMNHLKVGSEADGEITLTIDEVATFKGWTRMAEPTYIEKVGMRPTHPPHELYCWMKKKMRPWYYTVGFSVEVMGLGSDGKPKELGMIYRPPSLLP